MDTRTAFAVAPLCPVLGGRVTGIDLRESLDSETAAALRRAFNAYSVLCFPEQKIDADDQIRFASIFGRADAEKGAKAVRLDDVPKDAKRGVMFISNLRKEGKPIGDLPDGELQFHSDGSHRPNPYRATTLFGLKVTSIGGETKFASMAAAYDALSIAMKHRIDGRKARHVYDKRATRREETSEDDDTLSSAVHNLIRIHPETGRKSLYVSRLMTRNIIDLPRAESDELLETLCAHAERPEFIYAHSWKVGDLLIWDNRAVNHARNDFPSNQERHLRRVTVSDPASAEIYNDYA